MLLRQPPPPTLFPYTTLFRSFTGALYRLDRSNTRAPAANSPGLTVQTGRQRSSGFELGITGTVTSAWEVAGGFARQDRKSTRLNSSHLVISYAVFCMKKKTGT